MNELSTQTPESFHHAARIARSSLVGLEVAQPPLEQLVPPIEIFDYFFTLQGEVERSGNMSYHDYAARMWTKLAPGIPNDTPGFRSFSGRMITGLHGIDMSKLVYTDITETMPLLLETYRDRINGLAIWSTGDVEATGYQLGKIHNSRVVHNFLGTLKQSMEKPERSSFVRNKTSYLVANNKFNSLRNYVDNRLPTSETDEPLKIVIIEDSISNFDKAHKVLHEHIVSGKVVVVPIWFTGSREGLKAQQQVDDLAAGDHTVYESAKAGLEQKKTELNAISSFVDLLNTDRFGDILDGAHVMVDFDGVIGDNIEMRKVQASAIYHALLSGTSTETGLDQKTLEAGFLAILRQAAQV